MDPNKINELIKSGKLDQKTIDKALSSGKFEEALNKVKSSNLNSNPEFNSMLTKLDNKKFNKIANDARSQEALAEMAKDPIMMMKLQEQMTAMRGKTQRTCRFIKIEGKKKKKIQCGEKFYERKQTCFNCLAWCDSCRLNCKECKHEVKEEVEEAGSSMTHFLRDMISQASPTAYMSEEEKKKWEEEQEKEKEKEKGIDISKLVQEDGKNGKIEENVDVTDELNLM